MRPIQFLFPAILMFLICAGNSRAQQSRQGSPTDIEILLKAAEQGDATAQFNLGLAYIGGRGVAQNYPEALKWHLKAAEQGDVRAQNSLGSMYQNGLGTPVDYSLALTWYRRAAEQGDPQSQFSIGTMYLEGKGVSRDTEEAGKWLLKAAEQGNVFGQFALGWMYTQQKNYAEAVKWLRRSAERGYFLAQNNLGTAYLLGLGVEQDSVEALQWYRKAAEQGDGLAQLNMGRIYAEGKGIPQDLPQAYFWLNLSTIGLQGNRREEAAKLLGVVADKLTPEQIANAQRLGKEWRPKGSSQNLIAIATPQPAARPTPQTASGQAAAKPPMPIIQSPPAQARPIVPTLEQIGSVPSFVLGQGYQAVESSIGIVEMAVKYPNMKTILTVDGNPVTIGKENAPGILQGFNDRLSIYRQAIEQRGYSKIGGWYVLEVNETIAGQEGFDVITLFADRELSGREYILAREVQIKQQDFRVKLVRERDIGGEKKDLSFPGLAIGNSVVFEVPNVNMHFYGTLNGDTIELKVDLNEIKRSQSIAYAVESVTNPAKAAASELKSWRLSEWFVRLKRNPDSRPTEPSPSDQLIIAAPDSRLRHVTREEIPLK